MKSTIIKIKTMTDVQKFIESLEGSSIIYSHDNNEEYIQVHHVIGNITLEFHLYYDTETKNYRPSTHWQPEECDFVFTNTNHDEIAIYEGAELIEITDKEFEQIDDLLCEILY